MRRMMEMAVLMGGGAAPVVSPSFKLTVVQSVASGSISIGLGAYGGNITVLWGDGASNTYSPDTPYPSVANKSHTYALGTYTLEIQHPENLYGITINSSKITLNVNAANPWPTNVLLLVTVGAHGVSSSWIVSESSVANNIFQVTMSGLNIIGTLILPGTNLNTLKITGAPNLTIPAASFANFIKAAVLQYENTLSQAAVDAIVSTIYSNRMSFTYDPSPISLDLLGGGNDAPSGIYQDATPPTTGNEFIYKLVNDPDSEGFYPWVIQTA